MSIILEGFGVKSKYDKENPNDTSDCKGGVNHVIINNKA